MRLTMKLLALTFVRTGELIGAPWSEIDFKARRWEIPAERMKMRTPHIVPLSDQAIEVLQSLHALTGAGKWLFPGDRDSEVTMYAFSSSHNQHDAVSTSTLALATAFPADTLAVHSNFQRCLVTVLPNVYVLLL